MAFDNASSSDLPPPYEEGKPSFTQDLVEPSTLVLKGQNVFAEGDSSMPLYEVSGDVTAIPQKLTSMRFERLQQTRREKPDSIQPAQFTKRHLFYLVHPLNASFRSDRPPYYLTSMAPNMIGNIILDANKSKLQKPRFTAMLSPGKSAENNSESLFESAQAQQALFQIKPNWNGSSRTWSNSKGEQVAVEEEKSGQLRISITAPLSEEMRDALVAVWVLRLWHDTAETREARRDFGERMTSAEQPQRSWKLPKHVEALGALAGASV